MVQIGSLAIHIASPTYRRKLGFDDRPVGTEMASVWLCEGSAGGCGVPEDIKAELSCPETDMWAKIQARRTGALGPVIDWIKGVPTQYHCVTYREHLEVEDLIPATMRWRWRKDDEGLWAKCRAGCCELT